MSHARVVHSIAYRFEEPVAEADLVLRLSPRSLAEQRVLHHQIIVEPRPATTSIEEDEHGQRAERVTLRAPFRSLEVRAVSTVARTERALTPEAREEALALLSRCGVLPAIPPFPEAPRDGREACRVRAEATLVRLRDHGIVGRYVGGYTWPRQRGRTLPHAWVAIEIPGHGWIEFDASSGALAPGHVVVGWGRGYDDVAPISGSLRARGRYRLVSSVVIEPLP